MVRTTDYRVSDNIDWLFIFHFQCKRVVNMTWPWLLFDLDLSHFGRPDWCCSGDQDRCCKKCGRRSKKKNSSVWVLRGQQPQWLSDPIQCFKIWIRYESVIYKCSIISLSSLSFKWSYCSLLFVFDLCYTNKYYCSQATPPPPYLFKLEQKRNVFFLFFFISHPGVFDECVAVVFPLQQIDQHFVVWLCSCIADGLFVVLRLQQATGPILHQGIHSVQVTRFGSEVQRGPPILTKTLTASCYQYTRRGLPWNFLRGEGLENYFVNFKLIFWLRPKTYEPHEDTDVPNVCLL